MSVDEAYANAVINEALSTDDEEADEEVTFASKADLNAQESPDEGDKKNLWITIHLWYFFKYDTFHSHLKVRRIVRATKKKNPCIACIFYQ